MKFEGVIREEVEFFNPEARELWRQHEVPWLVIEPPHRFTYCRTDNDGNLKKDDPFGTGRLHYFTAAWFIYKRQKSFDMIWQERYKLALNDEKAGPTRLRGNSEIEELMEPEAVAVLKSINPKIYRHSIPFI